MIDGLRERAAWIEANLLPHEARIRAWLSRYRSLDIDTDDVIQEMYARIGSLEDVCAIQNPVNYAISVANSIVLNLARRPHVVTNTATGDLEALEIASLQPSPEDEADCRGRIRILADALTSLPERTRTVLWLRRVEELTEQETADRLTISSKTVERHLARAILHLMKHLGRMDMAEGVMTKYKPTNSDETDEPLR